MSELKIVLRLTRSQQMALLDVVMEHMRCPPTTPKSTSIAARRRRTRPNLKAQINDLVAKGVLHPLMKDWADEVRILANESAHPEAPIPEDATPQDSRDIVNFLDLLLMYLYDLPTQIENYRQRKNPPSATP